MVAGPTAMTARRAGGLLLKKKRLLRRQAVAHAARDAPIEPDELVHRLLGHRLEIFPHQRPPEVQFQTADAQGIGAEHVVVRLRRRRDNVERQKIHGGGCSGRGSSSCERDCHASCGSLVWLGWAVLRIHWMAGRLQLRWM
jgi:hypothetical protein